MVSLIARLWLLAIAITVKAVPLHSEVKVRDVSEGPLSPVTHSSSLPPTIIYETSKGTWLENFVIRQQDGNAVVTVLTSPDVYLFSTTNEFEPVRLAHFDGNLGCLGIVEMGHDVFYVGVGNWSASTGEATPGTWSIWEMDLNGFDSHSHQEVSVTQVAALPDTGFLNGMTVLNPNRGTILVADSLYSSVWSVNVRTGNVDVAINDTTMSILQDATGLQLGINAISNIDGYLYYDNTNRATFCRIPIDRLTGQPLGPAEILVKSNIDTIFPDDFVIDFAGNAWMTSDKLSEVSLLRNVGSGEHPVIEIVAGDRSDASIAGFTAAHFGTSKMDLERGALYVTTNGGPVNYFFSNWTSGGMLLRYDTAQMGL